MNKMSPLSLTAASSIIINTVEITDLIGQVLFKHNYNAMSVHIDVADLPTGTYLIKINGTEVRKFVKE